MLQEKELTTPVDLCLPNGRLNPQAVGWSRQPLQNCRLYGHPLRKKRWNYWCITSPTHLFSVTLSDVDYAGLPFVYSSTVDPVHSTNALQIGDDYVNPLNGRIDEVMIWNKVLNSTEIPEVYNYNG